MWGRGRARMFWAEMEPRNFRFFSTRQPGGVTGGSRGVGRTPPAPSEPPPVPPSLTSELQFHPVLLRQPLHGHGQEELEVQRIGLGGAGVGSEPPKAPQIPPEPPEPTLTCSVLKNPEFTTTS